MIDFSPNERYLVTWSNEPINVSRIPEGSVNPFTEEDEGNQIVIWDTLTGALLRSFPVVQTGDAPKAISWPMFKWAPTEKYFARCVAGQQISIYEAPSMGLVGKKSVKIDGVADFEWSPANPNSGDEKIFQKEEVLAYWTPEVGNQPARVTIMGVPSKEIIRTKNLFNVNEVSQVEASWLGISKAFVLMNFVSFPYSASFNGNHKVITSLSRLTATQRQRSQHSPTLRSSVCAKRKSQLKLWKSRRLLLLSLGSQRENDLPL